MAYANTIEQNDVSRVPELGRLKAATERLANVTGHIDAFLCRFNGPRTAVVAGEKSTSPPAHYRNDIEELFRQIAEVENRVAELNEIG